MLGIAHNPNQSIYQVAVRLTEEWEKVEPPPTTSQMEINPTSHPRVSALAQLARNRRSDRLTFQLQSYLSF